MPRLILDLLPLGWWLQGNAMVSEFLATCVLSQSGVRLEPATNRVAIDQLPRSMKP